MTADLSVVDRGGSITPYRARKPPTAIEVELNGYEAGILVLRTHNLEDAVPLAVSEGLTLPCHGERLWIRYVGPFPPGDSPGQYERELRGTPGATPAILFATPRRDLPESRMNP